MTTSLALCIDAPMQSWGTTSRFTIRDTAAEPTKSGIVGLLAAALGLARTDSDGITRLAALRMGVRADREGLIERDYHTTQNVPTTLGGGHRTVVSHRYYLADALFLVVLEGKPALLADLHTAVQQPRWPLFFGRKAFVPARPLLATRQPAKTQTAIGLVNHPLETVLQQHPWLENRHDLLQQERRKIERREGITLRTVIDCPASDPHAQLRHDHPLSFTPSDRRFAVRSVRHDEIPLTAEMITAGADACS